MSCWIQLVLALALLSAAAAKGEPLQLRLAWPHQESDLQPTPRVEWGRLDNGVRYAVLPHATPAGRVSLRLLVLAGSLHENDDERGFAHFVEHMAFNGTRSYPPGQMVRSLQASGIAFGPHMNAYTSYATTSYKLELPDVSPGAVAEGLGVLRDIADGILFENREVKRERGVVLNEMLARQDSERVWNEAINDFLYQGTRVPLRSPLGLEAAVKKATSDKLRAYYDAWYRPERMVLVVVGDIDPGAVQTLLRQSFGSVSGRGPRRPEPELGSLAGGQQRIHVHTAPRAGVEFDVFSIRIAPRRVDNAETRLEELRLTSALAMLRERFRRMVARPEASITNFAVRQDRVFNAFDRIYITTVGSAQGWEPVLGTAEQEIRRVLTHGFHPTELLAHQVSLRASIHAAAAEAPTLPSNELADDLANAIDSGRVFNLADEERDAKLAQVELLAANDCWRAFRRAWTTGAEMLFVGADPAYARALKKVELALQASRAIPVEAPSAVAPVELAYGDFGPADPAAEARHIPGLDAWLVRFANGVRLNVKTTAYEKNMVRFRVRFGGGRRLEPPALPGISQWGGVGWIYGGLGRQGIDDVLQSLNGRVVSFSASAADDAMQFSGHSAPGDLPAVFDLLAAFFIDPAFSEAAKAKIAPYLNTMYSDLARSSAGPTQRAILPYLSGSDHRFGLPPHEVLSKQTMTSLKEWMLPQLQHGPLEIAMVGEVTVDQAISIVAGTLGTLPPRGELQPAEVRLEFPTPPALRRFRYTSDVERPTTVALYWPVRDALPATTRRRLLLLAAVLEDRLRVKVREEMGATYAPKATFNASEVYPGFAHLRCELQVQPASARRLLDAAVQISGDLATRGVNQEELERAKAQYVAQARRSEQTNAYWLDEVLSDAQQRPISLEDARTLQADFSGATDAELSALAKTYLQPTTLYRFLIDARR